MINFTGIQIYDDVDGKRQVNLFDNGMITPLEPNEEDMKRPLGFYDVDMNPVADPTSKEARIDAAMVLMDSIEARLARAEERQGRIRR